MDDRTMREFKRLARLDEQAQTHKRIGRSRGNREREWRAIRLENAVYAREFAALMGDISTYRR